MGNRVGEKIAGVTLEVWKIPTPMNPRHLRIAQVSPLWTCIPPTTYGGIELLVKLLVDELVAQGHSVTLFATGDCNTAGTLHPIADACLTELMARGDANAFEHYANAVVAETLRRASDFDILHFHLTPGWLPLASLSQTPSLFTLHTCALLDDEWAFARYPNVEVAAISHFQIKDTAARLSREFPVVYNGCDFEAYEPSLEKGGYLAFLGRMSHAKNPAGAIAIAKACGLPLVLAGKPQNGPEERYFAEEVLPHVDGKTIRWIGPVNHAQKADLLRNASALLFPIQWDEPFGLVMIEAMACGTPVVAVKRGSVGEVVEPGITGYTAATPEALAEWVAPALALDRQKVRAAGEAKFGFRKMVADYLSLYRRMLGKQLT
jgi:glycosyltransferase involved in cell wall biosynthesis